MTTNLADLRKEYTLRTLDVKDVDADPVKQFTAWMEAAIHAQLPEPSAMHLATVDAAGKPSGRIVLLKGADEHGFVFFTNYESRKGRDLAANPHGAMTFLWKELERQVRIEGRIAKIDAAESDAYYASRPVGARVGAWASPQSRPIETRGWLEARWEALGKEYGGNPPRPPHWGGYRLMPDHFEFWQGRMSRLHDRIVYDREEGEAWRIRRLAP